MLPIESLQGSYTPSVCDHKHSHSTFSYTKLLFHKQYNTTDVSPSTWQEPLLCNGNTHKKRAAHVKIHSGFTEGVWDSSDFKRTVEVGADQSRNRGRSDGVQSHYAGEIVQYSSHSTPRCETKSLFHPPTRSKVCSFQNTFVSKRSALEKAPLKASGEAFNGRTRCETHLSASDGTLSYNTDMYEV